MDRSRMESTIGETVRRIVETVQPKRVVLFGSAARGEMGPDSDLDFLVVVPDGNHRRKTAQRICSSLVGVGFASDIVVVTESDIDAYQDNPGTVIAAALREGRAVCNA